MTNDNNVPTEEQFTSLKADIDRRFPPGRFVAIEDDQVVADAETVRKLVEKLTVMGKDPRQMQAVQAGVDYPKTAVILAGGIGRIAHG